MDTKLQQMKTELNQNLALHGDKDKAVAFRVFNPSNYQTNKTGMNVSAGTIGQSKFFPMC